MVKILLLFVLIVTYPVFASCPVESEGGACVAEFQPVLQDIIPPVNKPAILEKQKEFSGINKNVTSKKEIEPIKKPRDFGSAESNYGYNSSCQFGICSDTGTPKNFQNNINQ